MLTRARLVDTDGLRTYGYTSVEETGKVIVWGGGIFVRRPGDLQTAPSGQPFVHFDRQADVLHVINLDSKP